MFFLTLFYVTLSYSLIYQSLNRSRGDFSIFIVPLSYIRMSKFIVDIQANYLSKKKKSPCGYLLLKADLTRCSPAPCHFLCVFVCSGSETWMYSSLLSELYCSPLFPHRYSHHTRGHHCYQFRWVVRLYIFLSTIL